ncbi:alpha carbonic anhydrase 7 isoform X1 [Dendrobium catenatum]|uniref:Carbonic anhydrase n=1 Tax=Dendrobium catenatum TaxID=906689 RepID=A0A2I0VDU4_9ASPA|nr:alpha carbonic anhydrase 7 isoform X1 [Dendrobium catenatum]PKU61578.1 Bifunctional monodehydroascorbate reductase and carbonic anhydrase nectarin-3 [Dendrobium catenatum]
MAGPASKLAVISPFLIVLLLSPLSNGQLEVEDEKEFSYEVGSENGPDNWGQIHEDWAACGVGKLQSPIDLKDERVEVVDGLGLLRRTYRPAPAVMKNRGHDIMLKWEGDAGGLWINGTEYKLKQLHWHSSSEHTINEHRYHLELHMVHESAYKKIAVVGILYQLGRPDRFLAKVASYIKKLTDLEEGAEEKLGWVNPWRVRWGSKKYYRYMGSLTTPPCTEGVTWTIIKKIRTVSREQVRLLREAVHDEFEDNARPTQPINERDVFMYRPKYNWH